MIRDTRIPSDSLLPVSSISRIFRLPILPEQKSRVFFAYYDVPSHPYHDIISFHAFGWASLR